jgi:uncharacterized protein YndB with AHSA1/START domain
MSAGGAAGDQARVSVVVAVAPDEAFRVFTQEIDAWWRRGARYRVSGKNRGLLRIEPGIGGRVFESIESASGTRVFESGTVTAWEPPTRLAFTWRAVNFAPHELTEVEVRFEPASRGTLVTVTHRGWSQIRPDHPARHGLAVAAFLRMIGLWWGDLMSSLREYASDERA